jgi:hypothetical protein
MDTPAQHSFSFLYVRALCCRVAAKVDFFYLRRGFAFELGLGFGFKGYCGWIWRQPHGDFCAIWVPEQQIQTVFYEETPAVINLDSAVKPA